MGAYNWINFEAICSACHQLADIRCQTHIASAYDGDENDRFHNREYHLGDKMAWRPENHKKFLEWRDEESPDSKNLPVHQAVEACYSSCQNCKADLCAVILFDDLRPIEVLQLVLEENWPKSYSA